MYYLGFALSKLNISLIDLFVYALTSCVTFLVEWDLSLDNCILWLVKFVSFFIIIVQD